MKKTEKHEERSITMNN